MAAVLGLDDARIEEICNDTAGVVEAVNYNSPGQVVIAGHTAAVEAAIDTLKGAGAKRAMLLPVSAPFHTSLMRPAGEKLAQALADLQLNAPVIPVVHNVHAQTESDPAQIKQLLTQQIYSAVKWVSCVQAMVDAGVENTLECGPGKVLSGLNKRIQKSLNCMNVDSPESLEAALAAVAQ